MKYKVGDEVLVKARIVEVNAVKAMPYTIVREKNVGYTSNSMLVKALDIVQKPDMTAEEAWEIAKKLFADYSNTELDEIFGEGWSFPKLMELTPKEAKAKIEAWEAAKEIKVGDVVIPNEGKYREGECGLVVCITATDKVGVNHPGNDFTLYDRSDLRNTGRHIDIEGLLKQIGGDE